MNKSQNYMVLVTGKTGGTAHLCITADSPESACVQAKSGGYIDAQIVRSGATYEFRDASGWHILFSDLDFEAAEHITLFSTADGEVTMVARPDTQYEAFTGV